MALFKMCAVVYTIATIDGASGSIVRGFEEIANCRLLENYSKIRGPCTASALIKKVLRNLVHCYLSQRLTAKLICIKPSN